jgi:hypothetical protein
MDLLDLTFRSNPAYRLVLRDRLARHEIEQISAAGGEDFGFLCPINQDHLPLRAIDAYSALLFFALQEPGTLPSFFRAELGSHARAAAKDLVLAGVFEVFLNGRFTSGASALPELGATTSPATGDSVSEDSLAALRYGFQLQFRQPDDLWPRLYFFNRYPLTPSWKRALSSTEQVCKFLHLSEGQLARTISDKWTVRWPEPPINPWIGFSPKRPDSATSDTKYKLYISPIPKDLPAVLDIVARQLAADHSGLAFKCSGDATHLLRPDKLVVYMDHFDELALLAEDLDSQLSQFLPHPVPFTARIGSRGILSWGIDPTGNGGTTEKESWRVWICKQLSVSLVQAQGDGVGMDGACAYALERIGAQGVSTASWAPLASIFKQ